MAKTKATKEKVVSLEDVLWECRVALRGVGSLDKNRNAVITIKQSEKEQIHINWI